jgi:arylsulfatase A-like enzyme
MNAPTRQETIRSFAIGTMLGVAVLVVSGLRALAEFSFVAQGHKVIASVDLDPSLQSPLVQQSAAYLASLLIAHVGLGCAAAFAGVLSRFALPKMQARAELATFFWFAITAYWVFAAYSVWFPASIFSFSDPTSDLFHLVQPVVDAAAVALPAIAAIMVLMASLRAGSFSTPARLLATAGILVIVGVATTTASIAPLSSARAGAGVESRIGQKPNIILVGIDSLRTDLTMDGDGRGLTPNIDAFLRQSHVFPDAITPLARTYPAWVSILTGKHPVSTNARFNLMPRSRVDASESLGFDFKTHGYRTIYATDEVRFANIDASFGFDQVITPPIGAADFVLGSLNDLPLPNVLSRTILGRWLFPHTYANRAAYVTYRPDMFEDLFFDSVSPDKPLFIAAHLTLAHYPYSWAGRTKPTTPEGYRKGYADAVAEVDRQFGRVMDGLRARGVLDSAIVVLLSDHGEALGGKHDTMLRGIGTADQVWSSVWGHGTSVMSPHQYQVLLAFREFGKEVGLGTPGTHGAPASIEDIRSTLIDLVEPGSPIDSDGLSLAPILRGQLPPAGVLSRVRFTETDFNTPSVLRGKYDADGALSEGAEYYEVAGQTGWVQLKADRLKELMDAKERAAVQFNMHLAALPSENGEVVYLLTEGDDSLPMHLGARPDPASNHKAALLWDALHDRFRAELGTPR